MSEHDTALCWFRRDLRMEDHAALYSACRQAKRVIGVFIFDSVILDPLPDRQDRRVEFIWRSVEALKREWQAHGSDLLIRIGDARDEIVAIATEYRATAVFASRDYEPAAVARDQAVAQRLQALGACLVTVKDQVIFDTDEVLTKDGRPYSVFTPYRNAWLAKLSPFYVQPYPIQRHVDRLVKLAPAPMPSLLQVGFGESDLTRLNIVAGEEGASQRLADFLARMDRYRAERDYPARKAPSYLSVHLRFGTVSVRKLAALAWQQGSDGAQCWLDELIWREFYQMILHHHPHVVGRAFKSEYAGLVYPGLPEHFEAWKQGGTGYPLVDAAMRQLNFSGYMHNRLRMVAASFLVKDLLVDWRLGEQYFAEKLIDFDLASNNGGWQWAASTGCDAQPYFRIFNPVSQSQKFDEVGRFIRRYVPELAALPDKLIHSPWLATSAQLAQANIVLGRDYPWPVVDHAVQRPKALALYGRG
ncbi:cryptochrome/photolyase family protein [Parachitinimonas caeni]|uniref:Deoxyribodipyrimidine photo-lyase n=1 Tax=Parachitinimonas caeni TaxID=3031301 RepID=A0ABT7DR79_9NEIS|nr:deoxyribodipyrimidine photo-lyase [Parachitinimonas caeni]MDK2122580.1 deoxyribodipyrimidine photo-lyase [Parachitinimonas caeni]